MLSANRLSVQLSIIDLLQGNINIAAAQLFGLHAHIYQRTPTSDLNCQFLIDAFKSKDDNKAKPPIDLTIGSLIIRNSSLQFDKWFMPKDKTLHKLDINHLNINNFNTHLFFHLNEKESISTHIKELSFTEASGLTLKDLHANFIATLNQFQLSEIALTLPNTQLKIDKILIKKPLGKKPLDLLRAHHGITEIDGKISFSDFAFIAPLLSNLKNPFYLTTSIEGDESTTNIKHLNIYHNQYGLNVNIQGKILYTKDSFSPQWSGKINKLDIGEAGIKTIIKMANLPKQLGHIKHLSLIGSARGKKQQLSLDGKISTNLGSSKFLCTKNYKDITGYIESTNLNIGKLLDIKQLGKVSTRLTFNGILDKKSVAIHTKGNLFELNFNGYQYKDVAFAGQFKQAATNKTIDANITVNDPNGVIQAEGQYIINSSSPTLWAKAQIRNLNLSAMHLSNQWEGTRISTDIETRFTGTNFTNAIGHLSIQDLKLQDHSGEYTMNNLQLKMGKEQHKNFASLISDFADIHINGVFNYSQLPATIYNIIGSRLPSIPGLPKTKATENNFHITAQIRNHELFSKLFHIPFILHEPLALKGHINDKNKEVILTAHLPHFEYENNILKSGSINLFSINDSLKLVAAFQKKEEKGQKLSIGVNATASHNNLETQLDFNNNRINLFKGSLKTSTSFFQNQKQEATAHIRILPSTILVSDSTWSIEPSDIIYSKNHLTVDHFAIQHNKQHIIISGQASQNKADVLTADLREVDLSYILNLVNFHAVSFSGKASGTATISSAFNHPEASANLTVDNFHFEDGPLGRLKATAIYDNSEGKINIDAIAKDERKETFINGYVSPLHNNIDLAIKAKDTNIEFLKSFCGSFMSDINATAEGNVRIVGPLNAINLTGEVVANGSLKITPTNTTYRLSNDTIRMIPDQIILSQDTVYDRAGNIGIVNGTLRHHNLTQLTYDLNITAKNLLAYDTHDFGDDTFYGTAYASGNCHIYEHNGEIILDIDVTPEKGSQFVYNAASPGGVSNQEFIHWKKNQPTALIAGDSTLATLPDNDDADIPSNMHINFLINMTPDATLRLLMDEKTGDYIALNGNGVLRATYFNKGRLDMYGNYIIDHGIYKLTIQNIIKKDFHFNQGGTIAFGGDPYAAALDLKAQYVVPAVSLSDLNIGQSFTTNNVRVNCLMNITGTPATPKLDFSLDIPSLNNEAKQMIFSLINSENEMNQQVLYLLAIGRFYSQGNNTESTPGSPSQQSQTSLAMQSLLSGTVSQQINNILSSVTKNDNWNFGANISTGNEGWSNAEYEGLLSGRLLNNRLLINGQFGYRDNATKASTSFIGDFEAKYLLTPSGNYAIRVYNQSNDRYFTRNSLNTQGIGFVIKKEFNRWRDLFRKNKSKKKKDTNSQKEKNKSKK
ncbi:translocation/assembly module TamB domain-containing protein [Prevotella sp.]|uniref:translocation/assembly module TamB domain-containing protein n=1 Tax=Prevotella sp. TaxID=59823 RepID=UPI002F934B43